ncbi:MAG TPA: bifunctional phosphoribosylaminoimidazolecarboxamide formyltransferase/IMP cyclohydrolase [Candidatus Acidoferrales bacterium]|nr:bifunctional phosphoribosylaminoimidazolecarboxamide formyltransferase/IMP cyclohydrolase [Candidatus Acidoferrales bacterium]
MGRVQRALISVSNKQGVAELAAALAELGVEIISTGGTAALLREEKIAVKDVSELTGFPEMMDGRVKTLHPKIHGGLLALRGNAAHEAQMKAHGIAPIDLVVVNLYPFEDTVKRQAPLAEIIEQIDIGGPAMVRSAAKNHAHVAVVVDPADYGKIIQELKTNGGELRGETRFRLAVKAFAHTARYDGAIANYLSALDERGTPGGWSETLTLQFHKLQELRYGENPQQKAAFYSSDDFTGPAISRARQIQGKELSFNNILDADAALRLVLEFSQTATVAIKHTNPCGVALSEKSLADSFRKARASDPVSIFGGVIAFNRPVDRETAEELKEIFLEIVIAPEFTPEAKAVLSSAKRLLNIRLLEVDMAAKDGGGYDLRRVWGGLLVQDWDRGSVDLRACEVVTERRPTEAEYEALDFAWRVCRHVKSNAIVFAARDRTLGIGAGQMSRVDSAKLAVMRAHTHGLDLRGSVVASDAFYPFRDGVDEAAKAGAVAVVQPGGSIKDAEVIAAANEHGMAMVFTGVRHFRH